MALSAEAIIALIALFIASVPGIRLVVQNRERLRQWWSRGTTTEGSVSVLSVHDRPNEENRENGPLNYTPDSHPIIPSYLPLSSTRDPPYHHRSSSIFEPIYTVLQRYENASRGQPSQRLESGIFFFARSSDTGQACGNDSFAGGSTNSASSSHEELHQLV
ncbi:uncharacterized protein P174DRAFT_446210 [Aspergillus novofumigatus IBT 16806]|uniref:Uncharacterized protein n=1 Tax=Aspergillus novofumigatus (strain IBT 16806) TaxID=1392255 RepID=A0A2I1BTK9_ASPN1|nr:uncharacterized protein P174DRAFT_446210 [Aspergillus novofumigatus IBT 16806]PKX88709.1 hypothetical protein P174DRAFT_446210 [Aspergillus novofumigatus IBT 16806]